MNKAHWKSLKERLFLDRLPKLKKDCDALRVQIGKDEKELKSLLPKEKQVHAKRLSELEKYCSDKEAEVEKLRKRKNSINDLSEEVELIKELKEPARLSEMQQRFVDASLS